MAKRKKLHWTQTPEGREIQSKRMKEKWKEHPRKMKRNLNKMHESNKRSKRNVEEAQKLTSRNNSHSLSPHPIQVAYICGRVEEAISSYCRGQNLVYDEVAKWVGEVLHSPASR